MRARVQQATSNNEMSANVLLFTYSRASVLKCTVQTCNPSEKSEFECPRGTLGSFHQRGMLIEADPVRGDLVTACCV